MYQKYCQNNEKYSFKMLQKSPKIYVQGVNELINIFNINFLMAIVNFCDSLILST